MAAGLVDCKTIGQTLTSWLKSNENSVPHNRLFAQLNPLDPVAYAEGLSVTSPRTTVTWQGNVYVARPDRLPFTTGAELNPLQWRMILNNGSGPGGWQPVVAELQAQVDELEQQLSGLAQDVANAPGTLANLANGPELQAAGETFPAVPSLVNGQGDVTALNASLRALAERDEQLRLSLGGITGTTGATNVGLIQGGKVQDAIHYVTPEMFGAMGGGVTDDYTAIQAAVNTGAAVVLRKGARYFLSAGVKCLNASCRVQGNGATLIIDANEPAFDLTAEYTSVTAVTSIAVESIDLTGGQGGSATTTNVLNVADSSAYAVGDLVKVVSDDLIAEGRPADLERLGETAMVAAVATGKIYLYSYLFEEFATNIRVAKMRTDVVVSVDDVEIQYTAVNSASAIRATGLYKPYFRFSAPRTKAGLLELASCFGAQSFGVRAKSLRTDFPAFSYGYGIVEYSCEYSQHMSLSIEQARHAYTDGTRSTDPGDARIERFGRTRYSKIIGGQGNFCQNAAWDTHYTSFGIEFIACHGGSPYNGPNGSQRNYQLRGRNGRCIGCTSLGGVGYYINQVVDHPLATQGNEVVDSSHVFMPGYDQNRQAFMVAGVTAAVNRPSALFRNCTSYQKTGDDPHYTVTDAEVVVTNPNVIAGLSGNSTGHAYRASSNGLIRVAGGRSDFRTALGTGIRMCRVLDDSSAIEISGHTVSGTIAYLVDMGSANGRFWSRDVDFADAAPSANSGIGYANKGAAAVVGIDYSVTGGRSGNSANLSATYAAGGAKTLDLMSRANPQILFSMTVNAAGASVGNVPNGAYAGQLLLLNVTATSTSGITVPSAGNIQVGATITIDIGKTVRLYWTGTRWIPG